MPLWQNISRRTLSTAAAKASQNVAPAPISVGEFYEHLQRCMPPAGWGDRLVVANSGGPDSVCLLHLLASVVKQRSSSHAPEPPAFPSRVYSVHVNHNLQAVNMAMQEVARDTAHNIGVEHRTEVIPWGTGPFPHKPESGKPIEEVARQARHARLLVAMQALNAPCIAYAHHADDQVETSLMRFAKGSQIWGAVGMRPIRRWGMGQQADIIPAGAAGMLHWIVRPLLDVSKDRILATCEANELEYAIDPTNFQPEITLRNSLRAYLQDRDIHLASSADTPYRPTWLAQADAESYEQAIQQLARGTPRMADLREATRQLGKEVERLEMLASSALRQCALPSPPSTVVLSHTALASITDPLVRHAIVRRILRYVSPKPWGTLAAVAHGDLAKHDAIVRRLWSDDAVPATQYAGGADVLWTPATLNYRGELRQRVPKDSKEPALWVVQRAPPMRSALPALTVDLTEQLRAFEGPRMLYLYDNRFWFRFDKEWAGEGISVAEVLKQGRVEIRPEAQQYHLPQVVWVREGKDDMLLGRYAPTWHSVPWIQTLCIRVLTIL
ncbi:tRNA lysidine(34) synthetase TilS [Phanerochaete sordida]|uniref:tRNA(Ile)-lysidine synthetase n=1 Tax=Phanerochaete sordida TaxID=48140 RepID=A0A9P3L9F4_9APHY|nr:tRNA lysidine(34) synthetase TilS [Phanerochaete sordida]